MRTLLGLAVGSALAATATAQTQPPNRQTPPITRPDPNTRPQLVQPPFPSSVYRMDEVNKSLNLTADQVNRLNELTTQTQNQFRDDFTKLGTLADAERFNRQLELNRQYTTDWDKKARTIFNDTQWNRYQQLNNQYGGFNTLYDTDVQRRLNLTPDQIKNLRENADWSSQQLAEINRVGATDAAKGRQMFTDYWTARQERMNKYLTPDQQKAWQQLTGDPFTFRPVFNPTR
jgi:hypothetical protein